jgi:hypothetical protein
MFNAPRTEGSTLLVADRPATITSTPLATATVGDLAEFLKVGDLVFIHMPALPFRRISVATQCWTNHVGIVVDVSGGQPKVAESKIPLSGTTTLHRFIARSDGRRAAVARLKEPLSPEQEQAVLRSARSRTPIFYDIGFDMLSHRQFCSRFVREVLHDATGMLIGDVESFLTLFERNPQVDLRFWRIWFLGRIPWERRTVTPASLLASPHLWTVFDGVVR